MTCSIEMCCVAISSLHAFQAVYTHNVLSYKTLPAMNLTMEPACMSVTMSAATGCCQLGLLAVRI